MHLLPSFRALELSSDKSSRAYRSLGVHSYFRKDYTSALAHFRRSVELNAFQPKTLLRLGYAAMEVEDWEEAAKAYRRYCAYESDVSLRRSLIECAFPDQLKVTYHLSLISVTSDHLSILPSPVFADWTVP